ncbi:MAG: cupin domain-containing protein [Variibacter sp.]|nr:cupin domain-containing protein [Variibacter sp.]
MRVCVSVGLVAGLMLLGAPAAAQDALSVAPDVFKKVMENPRIRVLEATFKPGVKVPAHSFSEHLFYMLSGGSLFIRPAGRTAYEMPFKVGEALYLPAQTRETENDGRETVRALIVELKGPPVRPPRGGKRGRGKRR